MRHPNPERERLTAEAQRLFAQGHTLYEISSAIGVSKEWLRTYAGLYERTPAQRRRDAAR